MSASDPAPGTYEITLLYPSHDRDEPVRQCNFKGVTRSFLQRLLMPENGFAGLIPLSELPDGEADVALDEVRIHIPEFVELVNGGMYLVVNLRTPISEQVGALQGWREGYVEADQVAATMHALDWLREAGHPEAKPLCVFTLRAGDMAVKVGGIVVAKSCAAILDAKTELNSDAATSMVLKIDAIRVMLELEEPSDGSPLGQLKGKQLLPVLSGRTVTSNTTDLDRMKAICQQHQIECWRLSRSAGVETISAGCFQSPHVPPFGADRGSATAAAAGKARTGSRMGTGSALPHLMRSNAFQQFSPRRHATLGQRARLRLY